MPVVGLSSLGCTQAQQGDRRNAVRIHFLEIVTPDADSACSLDSMMYGVTFSDPDQDLGGARTAELDSGGMLGVRAPLRDTEAPVVRPYVLVDDISAAVLAAAEAGAEIAVMPTEIASYGQFAIVIHGGIESGLWQI
jgi:predicted enzyme related to lactoylglutathione lyase